MLQGYIILYLHLQGYMVLSAKKKLRLQTWQSWRYGSSIFLTGAPRHPSEFYIQKRNGTFKKKWSCKVAGIKTKWYNACCSTKFYGGAIILNGATINVAEQALNHVAGHWRLAQISLASPER